MAYDVRRRYALTVKTNPLHLLLAFALTACGPEPTPPPTGPVNRPKAEYKEDQVPGTNYSISHHNLSKAQIDALRAAIAKLKFPLPDGTVDRLLPVRDARGLAGIGDVFGNKDGLLTVYVWHYDLNLDYVLLLRQGQYADKTAQPFRSYFRDEGAEIVRRDKLPKF